ncbi:MAG: response regulator transcription factor [Anaerolineales bacterium]|jgi:DNA-binding NarL/FixJ family response regulator
MSEQTILVVEDEDVIRESIADILELQGFRVCVAEDGLEGLRRLEEDEPDLILADIMMPNMNGYQFFQRVRSNPEWTWIPFIFLSAKSEGEDIRFGKEMGVDDYLKKPIEAEDLIAAVIGKLKRLDMLARHPSSNAAERIPYDEQPTRPFTPGSDLSSRELEVLALMGRGRTNAEIADQLVIGESTVKTHVSSILAKLDASNRVEAVARAFELRIIRPGEGN